MLKNKRHEILKKFIRENNIVRVDECVKLLDSSESTIRRDFEELEQQGFLKRLHGGAEYVNKNKDELEITDKLFLYKENKDLIGKYAASLVNDGDCIFLDAGSTVYSMIPYLENKNISVVTNGVTHISKLLEYNISTSLIGGQIKSLTCAVLGEEAVEQIKNYYFDKAFLGVNGISFENGFSTPDIREAVIKSLVLKRTRKPYFIADSSKFDKSCFAKIADLGECTVITNKIDENYEKYKGMIEMEVAE